MNTLNKIGLALLATISVASCSDSDYVKEEMKPQPKPEYSYKVTLTNITNNQPMSPLAFALHMADYNPWQIGSAASDGLEMLAEGGSTTDFLADPLIVKNGSGDGIIMPGMSQSITLTTNTNDGLMFSVASMLVNTNDAFVGLKQYDLSSMSLGDVHMVPNAVYDSGTELNSEASNTMPGPADNGIGFSSVRDDVNFVARHAGVVSADDGLTSSVLNQSHRFDGKVALISIERIK